MKVTLGSKNKNKIKILESALKELHLDVEITQIDIDSEITFRLLEGVAKKAILIDKIGSEYVGIGKETTQAIQNAYASYLREKGNLTYRGKSMGIIIDNHGNFLIDQLVSYGENDWNFPGGGIEEGETEEEAVLRELKEELGTDKFEILEKANSIYQHEWPDNIIVKDLKKKGKTYKGQNIRVFLIKFHGNKQDIKPDPREIKKIKWISYDELKDHLVFARQWENVEKILKEFKI